MSPSPSSPAGARGLNVHLRRGVVDLRLRAMCYRSSNSRSGGPESASWVTRVPSRLDDMCETDGITRLRVGRRTGRVTASPPYALSGEDRASSQSFGNVVAGLAQLIGLDTCIGMGRSRNRRSPFRACGRGKG